MESIAIEVVAQKGKGATKKFQSKRRGVFVLCSSRYLSSNWHGKLVRIVADGVWPVTEGVDGSDSFSGCGKKVSDGMSFGSLTQFGFTWDTICVIQCGICVMK